MESGIILIIFIFGALSQAQACDPKQIFQDAMKACVIDKDYFPGLEEAPALENAGNEISVLVDYIQLDSACSNLKGMDKELEKVIKKCVEDMTKQKVLDGTITGCSDEQLMESGEFLMPQMGPFMKLAKMCKMGKACEGAGDLFVDVKDNCVEPNIPADFEFPGYDAESEDIQEPGDEVCGKMQAMRNCAVGKNGLKNCPGVFAYIEELKFKKQQMGGEMMEEGGENGGMDGGKSEEKMELKFRINPVLEKCGFEELEFEKDDSSGYATRMSIWIAAMAVFVTIFATRM